MRTMYIFRHNFLNKLISKELKLLSILEITNVSIQRELYTRWSMNIKMDEIILQKS